jgi:hypothetical protein
MEFCCAAPHSIHLVHAVQDALRARGILYA